MALGSLRSVAYELRANERHVVVWNNVGNMFSGSFRRDRERERELNDKKHKVLWYIPCLPRPAWHRD